MRGKDRKAAVSAIKREVNRRRANVPIDSSSIIPGAGVSISLCETICLMRRVVRELMEVEFFPNSVGPTEREEAKRLIKTTLHELMRDGFYSLEGEVIP